MGSAQTGAEMTTGLTRELEPCTGPPQISLVRNGASLEPLWFLMSQDRPALPLGTLGLQGWPVVREAHHCSSNRNSKSLWSAFPFLQRNELWGGS